MGKYRPGQDLEMMQDPDEWPRYPHLPLKRLDSSDQSQKYQTGFLEAVGWLLDEKIRPIVWLGSLDSIVANRSSISYPNLEAVLADGWRVD